MHRINSQVACVSPAPGLYRLYYKSRLIGEAVTAGGDAFHVSHLLSARERFVPSLGDAANWLERIERAIAPAPLKRMV